MAKNQQPLVSIIVPVYNAARFIEETIATVQNQTYTNWELILIDDCSTDDSVKLIKPYLTQDKRIKLLKNKANSGAALTRNKGIDAAKGHYIAFLDADDLWLPDKLEKQVFFVQEKDCAFSFTGYEFADETGKPNGKKVHVPATISYKEALNNTTIYTCTVMLDITRLTKKAVRMPNIKSEDTATWWNILKQIDYAFGLDITTAYYRRHGSTLSSNKLESARRTWILYTRQEKLNTIQASMCFINYCLNALRRRM